MEELLGSRNMDLSIFNTKMVAVNGESDSGEKAQAEHGKTIVRGDLHGVTVPCAARFARFEPFGCTTLEEGDSGDGRCGLMEWLKGDGEVMVLMRLSAREIWKQRSKQRSLIRRHPSACDRARRHVPLSETRTRLEPVPEWKQVTELDAP
jgi:hypothetical protein